jgi:predicted dehydrogenase
MREGIIRVGLVGLGGISLLHEAGYDEVPELAQIAAVCDVNAEGAHSRAKAHDATVYTDYRQIVADPAIDLVDITTPHRLHYPVALAALEAGKHVLVEKPMAMHAAEAEHLVRTARERGLTFTVAENTRFVAAYQAAETVLRSGALGQIRLVRAFIGGSEAVRIRSQASWVGDPAEKGVVHDSGVHTFYLMRWLFGGIREVQAHLFRMLPESRVEDDATIIGRLDNGAIFVSGQSCIAEAPWTERLEVYGSAGSLIIDQLADPVAKHFRGPDDHEGTPLPGVAYDPLAWKYLSIVAEIADFVRAVAEGRPPLIDPADGAYAVRVSDAVYASVAMGRVVLVE